MQMYVIGMKPLLDKLVDTRLCKQVWYADDSVSVGNVTDMKKWWDELNATGPKFGYYQKSNTIQKCVRIH